MTVQSSPSPIVDRGLGRLPRPVAGTCIRDGTHSWSVARSLAGEGRATRNGDGRPGTLGRSWRHRLRVSCWAEPVHRTGPQKFVKPKVRKRQAGRKDCGLFLRISSLAFGHRSAFYRDDPWTSRSAAGVLCGWSYRHGDQSQASVGAQSQRPKSTCCHDRRPAVHGMQESSRPNRLRPSPSAGASSRTNYSWWP